MGYKDFVTEVTLTKALVSKKTMRVGLSKIIKYCVTSFIVDIIAGVARLFARGPILNIIFPLGPHIAAKQKCFLVFLMLIEKN